MIEILRLHAWLTVAVQANRLRERCERDLARLYAHAMRRAYRVEWK
jgi:hypothetical protein